MKNLENTITLREILDLVSCNPLPDTWKKWDDIRPQGSQIIKIAFMAEEETHIEAYAEHPILMPWYGCKVVGLDTCDDEALRIWLDFENYMNHYRDLLHHE